MTLLFIYYTPSDACYKGKIFISLNLTFCFCVSIVAVLPKVQVSLPEARRLVWGTSYRNLGVLGRDCQSQA